MKAGEGVIPVSEAKERRFRSCDREIMSYVATTGGICGDLVRDLMSEAIEARFGLVDKIPERLRWLSDNGPAYIARETRSFARMMGLEVCTTPYYSITVPSPMGWRNRSGIIMNITPIRD